MQCDFETVSLCQLPLLQDGKDFILKVDGTEVDDTATIEANPGTSQIAIEIEFARRTSLRYFHTAWIVSGLQVSVTSGGDLEDFTLSDGSSWEDPMPDSKVAETKAIASPMIGYKFGFLLDPGADMLTKSLMVKGCFLEGKD